MIKRLFIFAGYDADGIIDDALIHYIRQLHRFGDIVLCMDSDCKKSELDKLGDCCLHTMAMRHCEYDFGSYKRAYAWARDNNILNNYDMMYLVNDSVFGPMTDMAQILNKMESTKSDATGLVVAKHRTHKYMESWFVRLNKKIFTSTWFDRFITSVVPEATKSTITIKYEHGLSNLIQQNHCSWNGVYYVWGRYTYNKPKKLFIRGCPFIKRASFIRHNGASGAQIKYILNHTDTNIKNAIMQTATRIYGAKYMNWFLTYNPLKILCRSIKYAKHKLFGGKK